MTKKEKQEMRKNQKRLGYKIAIFEGRLSSAESMLEELLRRGFNLRKQYYYRKQLGFVEFYQFPSPNVVRLFFKRIVNVCRIYGSKTKSWIIAIYSKKKSSMEGEIAIELKSIKEAIEGEKEKVRPEKSTIETLNERDAGRKQADANLSHLPPEERVLPDAYKTEEELQDRNDETVRKITEEEKANAEFKMKGLGVSPKKKKKTKKTKMKTDSELELQFFIFEKLEHPVRGIGDQARGILRAYREGRMDESIVRKELIRLESDLKQVREKATDSSKHPFYQMIKVGDEVRE